MCVNISRKLQRAMAADFEAGRENHGVTFQSVALCFGKSPRGNWAYKLLHGEIGLPALGLITWYQATGGLQALRMIADRCGCMVIPRPDGHVRKATGNMIRAFGEFIARNEDAWADGSISELEFIRLQRDGQELIEAIAYLIEEAGEQARTGRAGTLAETTRGKIDGNNHKAARGRAVHPDSGRVTALGSE